MSKQAKLITRDAHGRPLRWRDGEGVLHAVEQTPEGESSYVASWWTRCGAWHISNSAAWGSNEDPTCAPCRVIEQGQDADLVQDARTVAQQDQRQRHAK